MLVHGDRPAPPKGGLVLSALFVAVRVGDLADDHDSCCRGDLKPLPYLPIGAALERQPVPEAFSERDAGQPVRRGIEPLEPGDQLGGVRRVQTGRSQHDPSVYQQYNTLRVTWQLPTSPKQIFLLHVFMDEPVYRRSPPSVRTTTGSCPRSRTLFNR